MVCWLMIIFSSNIVPDLQCSGLQVGVYYFKTHHSAIQLSAVDGSKAILNRTTECKIVDKVQVCRTRFGSEPDQGHH